MKKSPVTFENLFNQKSPFEVVILAAHRAIEIIKSGDPLRGKDDSVMPKLAIKALESLDDIVQKNPNHLDDMKKMIIKSMLTDGSSAKDEYDDDDYNVEKGHLPKQDIE